LGFQHCSFFAVSGDMQYLALLQTLQKNRNLIQNCAQLCESILPFSPSYEELCRYLHDDEPVFYAYLGRHRDDFAKAIDDLGRLQNKGVQFTFPGDSFYPASFLYMPGAPLLLSFLGHPCWTTGRLLAVVGSRDLSTLSNSWMEQSLADFLRLEKAVIVSGGARGVDQLAHQLAMRNHRPTVVVVPSGLGNLYPKNLEPWQTRVVDGGGCFLSEYDYPQEMRKHFFHDRNRLIAGLGVMTLLVEARRRSGSLLTAQKTLQLGKSVLVVPGHPSDSSHLGNLDLLADGATPIRDAQDLCMYFRSELNIIPRTGPTASVGLSI
jgi:DNA processing protein